MGQALEAWAIYGLRTAMRAHVSAKDLMRRRLEDDRAVSVPEESDASRWESW